MKTKLAMFFSLFLAGMLPAAASAQDEAPANSPAAGAALAGMADPVAGGMKPVAKKKKPSARKKKAAAPVPQSEYKFRSADPQAPYRFDKKGDPITTKALTGEGGTRQGKKKAAGKQYSGASAVTKNSLRLLPKSQSSAVRYVCPMGDYEGDKPGTCPKCGMTLVEKK